MSDELSARVRSLHAERARPDPGEGPSVEDLMHRLIGTLAALWTTNPDPFPRHTAPEETR